MGHCHIGFKAEIFKETSPSSNGENRSVKFFAVDKCLKKRKFLRFFRLGCEGEEEEESQENNGCDYNNNNINNRRNNFEEFEFIDENLENMFNNKREDLLKNFNPGNINQNNFKKELSDYEEPEPKDTKPNSSTKITLELDLEWLTILKLVELLQQQTPLPDKLYNYDRHNETYKESTSYSA